jgi:hypothetical protein
MKNIPQIQDKVGCSILYLGYFFSLATFVPIIWLIIANLRKIYLKDFVKYHCYQAILFNMIIFFFPDFFRLIVSFLSNLLGIFSIFDNSISLLEYLSKSFLVIYLYFVQILSLYAIIWTLRGKYTYIPKISQAVNYLLR